MASKLRPGRPVRDSVATKAAILDSAERIFARVGLHSARTEDIAQGCHVTKAMIHYYFDTKESLYRAVLERIFAERERGMGYSELEGMPPEQALAEFVTRLMAQMAERPHLGPLFALENIQNHGAYYQQGGARLYRVLAGILERGVADSVFRQQDPLHAAVNIIGACVHFFNVVGNVRILWNTGHQDTSSAIDQHCQAVVEFVLNAIGPAQGAAAASAPATGALASRAPARKRAAR